MTDTSTTVEYDPYSEEAMTQPQRLYAQLRAHDPVHFMPEYNAWALASFDAVWQACSDTDSFSVLRGQTPNQILLGEPAANLTFPELDPPEHRLRRRPLAPFYTRAAADADEPTFRELTRSILEPLVAAGTFDAFDDYASPITARFAAMKAGVPVEDADMLRGLLHQVMHRDPGQKGTSEANATAMGTVFGYLHELIGRCRSGAVAPTGIMAELLTVTVDGTPLDDAQIASELHTLLVTGSETTELGVAAALYLLDDHPDQKATAIADPSVAPWVFAEAIRYDHPTDMLTRVVRRDVTVGDKELKQGQGVLLLWGSANRDESVFPDADRFDISRRPERDLLFGHGQHKCIGEHIGMRMGSVLLEELFSRISDYTVDRNGVRRSRAEFL
ncbi:MAG: cytochrome P450, partial [Acidimicrobiales bacterium]|nr:cytochrome P450 [Acidimicrobiales bacterium]